MFTTSIVGAAGVIAVTAAVLWWVVRWMRRWRTTARLRWVQAYYGSLRAELQMSYERIYSRCADRPVVWTVQELADMESAFTEIDQVLERRRLEDLADLGRTVPAVIPSVLAAGLGGLGAVVLVAAAVVGS